MITTKLLRTNSQGISGTLANARHHAQECIPLINQIKSIIDGIGEEYDFTWEQGNNVHVIHRLDGKRIAFRPFCNTDGDWGIDVLAKFSRSDEMRLFSVTRLNECFQLGNFLLEFIDCGTNPNTYGDREHNNNSRAEA